MPPITSYPADFFSLTNQHEALGAEEKERVSRRNCKKRFEIISSPLAKLESLDKTPDALVLRAKENSKVASWTVYEGHYGKFETYCKSKGIQVHEVSSLIAYLEESLENGKMPNTLNTWVSAIKQVLKSKGVSYEMEEVYKVINNYKSSVGSDQSQGFNRDHVNMIYENVKEDTHWNVIRRLFFMVGLASFGRISQLDELEFTSFTRKTEGLEVIVNEKKRNKSSKDSKPMTRKIFIPTRKEPHLDICHTWNTYCEFLKTEGIPLTDKVWKQCIVSKDGKSCLKNQNMGRHKLSSIVKGFAKELGLNVEDFSAHSIRHSSASLGAEEGLSIQQLKHGGGWISSQVAESYVQGSNLNSKAITGSVLFGRDEMLMEKIESKQVMGKVEDDVSLQKKHGDSAGDSRYVFNVGNGGVINFNPK